VVTLAVLLAALTAALIGMASAFPPPAPIETVTVVVATKDLPVGTQMTRQDLKTAVTQKRMPKEALPSAFVSDPDKLVDRRLNRTVRAGEAFNPADLGKGGVITFPPGMDIVDLWVSCPHLGPGSRVDIVATVRFGDQIVTFPLLVNVVFVGHSGSAPRHSNDYLRWHHFAVDRQQALLVSLAKQRGCDFELMLRHPTKVGDDGYDIEQVKKLLADLPEAGGK
jgi:Flp pilus assembly protein CpaB